MKLSTHYPPIDLAADGSNLRSVLHLVWDQFRRIALAFNQPDSGATVDRPTTDRVVGQTYFDTSLGIPIWWNGAQWVDATGAVV